MDPKLLAEIKQAETEGWLLCAGCNPGSDTACNECPIETRKYMGFDPPDTVDSKKEGE
jgi:hypothetical protein